jgi:lipopolysaccharide cholinephosphotransferase
MIYRSSRRAEVARPSSRVHATDLPGWTRLTQSELRAAQIEILNSFADFCESNELSYFLYAGTLLGAVRHQGFIPWDDDIDVVMPRRAYDRLHSIASEEAAINGYSLCSPSTIPGFPWPFAKIADNPGTLSIEGGTDVNYRIGINIDVFPLDGRPSGLIARWIHEQSLRLLRGLIYSCQRPHKYKGKWSNLHEFALSLAKPVAKRIPIDWLVRKTSSRASRYSMENSDLVGVAVWGYPERVTSQAYSGIVQLPFEGHQYRAPSGYDAILSAKYGNYLQLPPPEVQVAQHAIEAFRLS